MTKRDAITIISRLQSRILLLPDDLRYCVPFESRYDIGHSSSKSRPGRFPRDRGRGMAEWPKHSSDVRYVKDRAFREAADLAFCESSELPSEGPARMMLALRETRVSERFSLAKLAGASGRILHHRGTDKTSNYGCRGIAGSRCEGVDVSHGSNGKHHLEFYRTRDRLHESASTAQRGHRS